MITRRGVLICGAATIGVHRARALSSEAQKEFCMDIDIKRNGSRPSQRGPTAPGQRTEYRIGYELTVDGGVTVPRWRREVK